MILVNCFFWGRHAPKIEPPRDNRRRGALANLVEDAIDLGRRLLARPLGVALEVAEHDGHVFEVVHNAAPLDQGPHVLHVGKHVLQEVLRLDLFGCCRCGGRGARVVSLLSR